MSYPQPSSVLSFFSHRQPYAIASTLLASLILFSLPLAPFIAEREISYPVLLDPGRKVNDVFFVEGIPKSFVYHRSGKMVAHSIDMRTGTQFLEMLAQAGLQ